MSDVSAVNPFAPKAPTAPTGGATDQLGADTFLQLLVAQLKYQDPTSPADGTEFLAQTAQFTMVEKLSQLAEQGEANAIVSRNLGAASLVGRTVTWLNADGTTGTGVVSAARLGTDGPVLRVGGTDVPFDHVSEVATAAAPKTTTTTTTTAPASTPPTTTAPTNSTGTATDDGATDQPTPATDGASTA